MDHSKQEIEIQKADYDSRLTKLQMEHELELENVEARYKQELTQLNARITEIQVPIIDEIKNIFIVRRTC